MMMFFWLLILIVLGAAIWWFAQKERYPEMGRGQSDRAETILRERFARGEIDEETYRRQLDELRSL